MPANRKPISILQASGAVAKNPQRFHDRKSEPVPSKPVGNPPKTLDQAERKAWKEIISNAAPGTLGNSDRIALEIASKLLVRFRAGEFSKASEVSTLVSLLARFGMTPADRAKLQATEKPPEKLNDEWGFTTNLHRAG